MMQKRAYDPEVCGFHSHMDKMPAMRQENVQSKMTYRERVPSKEKRL